MNNGGPAITSLKTDFTGAVVAKWAKNTTFTGYEVQYAPSKSFTGAKSVKTAANSTVSKALTDVKAGTTYYVRIRGYKTVEGVNFYGPWGTAKSITTPKADLVRDFVARLYRVCLDREPEQGGLTWWVNRLKAKQETGGSCAWGFFNSTEFKNHKYNNSQFLDHAYLAFFNRVPDTSGKEWWLMQMKAGTSRKAVIEGFAASNEWKALCKKYGIKP